MEEVVQFMGGQQTHKLNKEKGRRGTGRCGGQEIWIERRAFPSFYEYQENWMEFRRIFKEMLKISKLGPLLEVAQLASKLAEEAKRLIMGVEEPVEAWRLLVERYL